jgi:hypothetical protein
MLDVVYVAATVLFFGLMLAYVRACDVIGRSNSSRDDAEGARS